MEMGYTTSMAVLNEESFGACKTDSNDSESIDLSEEEFEKRVLIGGAVEGCTDIKVPVLLI